MQRVYTRKVSVGEAKDGSLMVLKNKLAFFPPGGAEFALQSVEDDAPPLTVRVESYPCTCQGPEYPHEHYFIRMPDLVAGDKVEITNDDGKYTYRVIR